MKQFAEYAAKALAVPVVAIVFMVLSWLSENAGINIPIDTSSVETWTYQAILAAITAFAVYWKKNKSSNG